MATHDYIISNASGAAVRADLNNALAAIATNNSSATEPTTTYAYQWWADTGSSPTVMKLRNAANSAWITLFQLDGEWSNIAFENGTAAAPSIYFKDSGTDTGIYSPGTDQVAITTGGTGRLFVDSSGRVGLGTSSPSGTLEVGAVSGAVTAGDLTVTTGSTTATVTIGRLSSTGNDNTIFNIRNRVGTSTLYINSGDGRLGIGTNSPSALLDVVGNSNTLSLSSTSTDATTKEAKITCRHYTNSEENAMLVYGASTSTDNAVILGGGSSAQNCATYIQFITAANNTTTSGTERARIDSSGRLLVGTASAVSSEQFNVTGSAGNYITRINNSNASPSGLLINYTGASPNGTSNEFLLCFDNASGGTTRASIRSNGGLANYSANNVNLSDINAKKDIAPAAGTWDCLKEWEIVNFRYKDQPDDADLNMGVIAQQVAENCPEVITVFQEATEDQPEKLGVKDQQMMWMAIKALQEAQLRIETLEAEVAALKGA